MPHLAIYAPPLGPSISIIFGSLCAWISLFAWRDGAKGESKFLLCLGAGSYVCAFLFA
ncbi:hypothetical protein [Myxococcus phage Mx1]|nr:hypothetical protein [Myxococcus phage Mx1]